MAVNWYWKHKLGEVIYKAVSENATWKLDIYGGNMMCCFIYNFKQQDEQTGEMKKMYRFFIWFNDLEHAKRVLKDNKDFFKDLVQGNHKVKKFKLCVTSREYKHSNNEMLKFAKLLTEYGYRVELY